MLHHNMAEASCGKTDQAAKPDLAASSDKATNAILGAPPSQSHLILMTSQRSYLQIPLSCAFGGKCPTYKLLRDIP